MEFTITTNESFKSTEILFDGKPSETIRQALKANGYRWHSVKKIWYGYKTAEEIENVIKAAENGESITNEQKPTERTKNAQRAKERTQTRSGVKVGDLFFISWGYEQTNIDFFQVVKIIGENSVRVKGVNPPIVSEIAVSGMSRDLIFENTSRPLPTAHSIFIKDEENGDIKRILSNSFEQNYINIDGRKARRYNGEKLYESWYA